MRKSKILMLAVLALALAACEARTDKAAHGGVILSISDFDGLPIGVSVSTALATGGLVQVEDITLTSIPADPTGTTSDLMTVEIVSYEVVFTRADTGTRRPPKLVEGIFGNVPVGGTLSYENLPILTANQLTHLPLSDLANFGFDRETKSEQIVLNCTLRFFGRTLTGDPVESQAATFTLRFSA